MFHSDWKEVICMAVLAKKSWALRLFLMVMTLMLVIGLAVLVWGSRTGARLPMPTPLPKWILPGWLYG